MFPSKQQSNDDVADIDDENTSLLSSIEDGSRNTRTYRQSRNGGGSSDTQRLSQSRSPKRNNKTSRSVISSTSSTSSLSRKYAALSPKLPPFSIRHSIQLCVVAGVLVVCSLLAGMWYGGFHQQQSNNNVTKAASIWNLSIPTNSKIGNTVSNTPSSLHDAYYNNNNNNNNNNHNAKATTDANQKPSKYDSAQFFGFQIYTGGAPAFIQDNNNSNGNVTNLIPNPECYGNAYGEVVLEVDPLLLCYLGHQDPIHDVTHRMNIMKDAVETAYQQSIKDPSTLKIFVAPEFYWRGKTQGSYEFVSLDKVFSDKCSGPICEILRGLEDIVEDERYEDWFFLFGTIIATQHLPTPGQDYQHLFYNFAPIYKGYNPNKMQSEPPVGKRFLLPKRYVSDSDFLRQPNFEKQIDYKHGWKELLGSIQNQGQSHQDPLYQPHLRYDDHLFDEYKAALTDDAGYTMIEYDWMIVDGITMTLEICFDHLKKTALNTYLGDMIKGRITRIPSTSDENGLQFVPIPIHQAQIGVVSSAGMTINANSMAVVENGTLFLQDGMSNASSYQYIDHEMWMTCDQAVQFQGGTEAVTRRSVVTNTDVNFLYQVLDPIAKVPIYPESEWKSKLSKTFTTEQYPPHLIVQQPVPLIFSNYHP